MILIMMMTKKIKVIMVIITMIIIKKTRFLETFDYKKLREEIT